MATSPILHFLLLSLFLSCRFSVYGATTTLFDIVPVESLRPSSICSPSSPGTEGAKVVYKYGPCSPLRDKYPPPTSHQILQNDQYRVEFLNTHKSMDPDTKFGVGNYLVTVELGTPKHTYTLNMDTGSDLTWVKCQPCTLGCSKELIFVPKASSTYSTAASCNGIGCGITYGDESGFEGSCAIDSLNIPGSGMIPHFCFGCGNVNSHDFDDYSGILGLSDGNRSIVSQDRSVFGQVFCYCLREDTTGFLLFGSQATSKCHANAFTPLLANPEDSSYYFVDLVGITIGTKRLNVSSFSSEDRRPITVLDSGTAITRLPPNVYADVRAEFRRLMSGYRESGRLPPLLDTCYDIGGERNMAIPKMTLHFKGVDVGLHWSGVIWQVNASRVCLGFSGNKTAAKFNIIGSTQQKTMGILYHIKQKRVKFMANAC